MRREVKWFAEEMEKKLKENDYKIGWSDCSKVFLLEKVEKHTQNLAWALWTDDEQEVLRCAINIANYSMMSADNARKDVKE